VRGGWCRVVERALQLDSVNHYTESDQTDVVPLFQLLASADVFQSDHAQPNAGTCNLSRKECKNPRGTYNAYTWYFWFKPGVIPGGSPAGGRGRTGTAAHFELSDAQLSLPPQRKAVLHVASLPHTEERTAAGKDFPLSEDVNDDVNAQEMLRSQIS